MWTHPSPSEGMIFCFSTGTGHKGLFVASPGNQRKAKKKAITSGGPVINGISCPISIRECMENKKRLSRVENTMEENALQVSKNA